MVNLPSKPPLGEILLEAGLISIKQIRIALEEQKRCDLKIGEILAAPGWIKQETANFFAEKWSTIIQQPPKRPLAFYLLAAGLLTQEQLIILKNIQKQKNFKTRLHSLAVEQGYIKQETVNFFLRYLYNLHNIQKLSFTNLYELIKKHINGNVNFQELELSQVSLNGVRLTRVILDDSKLRQANLNNSNLSHSSLIEVDLTLADLELANLSHVNLKQAILIDVNLQNSNLEQANFQAANLQEADLRGANLRNASFAAADLRGAKFTPAYSYDVYYDNKTIFDASFNPTKVGWKLRGNEERW
ncbi:MAG: pentapeptide repeat-containing protein [Xenococcus sp. MO_188.B8]|nr:pentapeptide repeat-containing protein [Xenococcus sp. MO_188.B8]